MVDGHPSKPQGPCHVRGIEDRRRAFMEQSLEPGSGSNNRGSFYLSTIRDESFEFRLIFCHHPGPLSKTFFSTDHRNQIFFSPNRNFSSTNDNFLICELLFKINFRLDPGTSGEWGNFPKKDTFQLDYGPKIVLNTVICKFSLKMIKYLKKK